MKKERGMFTAKRISHISLSYDEESVITMNPWCRPAHLAAAQGHADVLRVIYELGGDEES